VAALATTAAAARGWAGSAPMAEVEQPEAATAMLLHGVSQGRTRNGARGRAARNVRRGGVDGAVSSGATSRVDRRRWRRGRPWELFAGKERCIRETMNGRWIRENKDVPVKRTTRRTSEWKRNSPEMSEVAGKARRTIAGSSPQAVDEELRRGVEGATSGGS
jgi:hypothetical protein